MLLAKSGKQKLQRQQAIFLCRKSSSTSKGGLQPASLVKTSPGFTIKDVSTAASSPLNRGVAVPHQKDTASRAAAVTSSPLAAAVQGQSSLLSGTLQRDDNGLSSSTPQTSSVAYNKWTIIQALASPPCNSDMALPHKRADSRSQQLALAKHPDGHYALL